MKKRYLFGALAMLTFVILMAVSVWGQTEGEAIQISSAQDFLNISQKLDGEYVEKMSFGFDCKCFFGTITSVLKHDGVVEGGTGEMKREAEEKEKEAAGK